MACTVMTPLSSESSSQCLYLHLIVWFDTPSCVLVMHVETLLKKNQIIGNVVGTDTPRMSWRYMTQRSSSHSNTKGLLYHYHLLRAGFLQKIVCWSIVQMGVCRGLVTGTDLFGFGTCKLPESLRIIDVMWISHEGHDSSSAKCIRSSFRHLDVTSNHCCCRRSLMMFMRGKPCSSERMLYGDERYASGRRHR